MKFQERGSGALTRAQKRVYTEEEGCKVFVDTFNTAVLVGEDIEGKSKPVEVFSSSCEITFGCTSI